MRILGRQPLKDDPPNTEAFLQISTRAIGSPKKPTLLRSFKT